MSVPTTLAARLGIFARTFLRDTPEAVAAEVRRAGFAMAHWNFAALGKPTLADGVDDSMFALVRTSFDAAGVAVPSVSLTYNVVDPKKKRDRETTAAVTLIGRIRSLGAEVATLCTGTRFSFSGQHVAAPRGQCTTRRRVPPQGNPRHPAGSGSGGRIRLGVEPEPGNLVRDASVAARLLNELGQDAPVGIVFDPANLLSPATIAHQEAILTGAIDMLGGHIVSAHLKHVADTPAAANGVKMDYRLVCCCPASRRCQSHRAGRSGSGRGPRARRASPSE